MLLNCINSIIERFGVHVEDQYRIELVQLLAQLWDECTNRVLLCLRANAG